MRQPDDLQPWPDDIVLECGSVACFDAASGMGHRCTNCFAIVGSVSMPKECRDLEDMALVVQKLKGI